MTEKYAGGITLDTSRDTLLTEFASKTLNGFYLEEGESVQERFARAAAYYGSNRSHRQRLYDAASQFHMMYSSPLLSNAPLLGKGKVGEPLGISCFVQDVGDTRAGLVEHEKEVRWLTMMGGGCGAHWNTRAESKKSNGVIPFLHCIDAAMTAYAQSTTRKGSYAAYMSVRHPNLLEFIGIRTPTGDDGRKCLGTGFHHAVILNEDFRRAVAEGAIWEFIDPHDGTVRDTIPARELWELLLRTRLRTGEPYFFFKEAGQRDLPQMMKDKGYEVKSSQLCAEIMLPTTPDETAVCCLTSLNAEKKEEWDGRLVEDVLEMLDNVLDDFIVRAPPELWRAVKTAREQRAVGIGMMGFHYALQKRNIAFESEEARRFNVDLFREVRQRAEAKSQELAKSRGEPEAIKGLGRRNLVLLAVAPNANSAILANTSPSIEPVAANFYTHRTRAGSFPVKNKYIEKKLRELGKDDEKTWKSILSNGGSVQHLDFLSDHDKMVFKTAYELDQKWLVRHAIDRGVFIDQGQSLNLFFKPGCSLQYVSDVHRIAWEGGLKSLYYTRTTSSQRPDNITQQAQRKMLEVFTKDSLFERGRKGLLKLLTKAQTALGGTVEAPVEKKQEQQEQEEQERHVIMNAAEVSDDGSCESCQG